MKILYGSHSSKPLIFLSDTEKPSGLLIDIGAETAKRLKLEGKSIFSPRKRVLDFLITGKADLVCNTRPAWHGNPDYLTFVETVPDQDIYLTRTDTRFDFSNPRLLKGAKIGTILGFRYDKTFMKALNYGANHNAVPGYTNIWAMLSRGRIDAVVVSKTAAQYHLMQGENKNTYTIVDAGSPKYMLYCAVMTKHRRKDEIIAALNAMKSDGTLEKLYSKYRN
ncbi:MAG: transporter substrate-binding domain-containing protein [Sneathiella sp.]